MRPSTFVDGDVIDVLDAIDMGIGFNEAVDVCRRRHAQHGAADDVVYWLQ